jgi:hypothetical protein
MELDVLNVEKGKNVQITSGWDVNVVYVEKHEMNNTTWNMIVKNVQNAEKLFTNSTTGKDVDVLNVECSEINNTTGLVVNAPIVVKPETNNTIGVKIVKNALYVVRQEQINTTGLKTVNNVINVVNGDMIRLNPIAPYQIVMILQVIVLYALNAVIKWVIVFMIGQKIVKNALNVAKQEIYSTYG